MRLPPHIGRRGAFLIAKGLLFVFYGLALSKVVSNYPPPQLAAFGVLERLLPLESWATVWIAVGTFAVLAGLMPRLPATRPRPLAYRWLAGIPIRHTAFGCLMGVATLWSAGLLATYLTDQPVPNTWVAALAFLSIMASSAIVAGWEEPAAIHES